MLFPIAIPAPLAWLYPPELAAAQEAVAVPLYKRWWFWAIIGGVAASAAGGTTAALAAGDQGTGLPPTSLGTIDLTGR